MKNENQNIMDTCAPLQRELYACKNFRQEKRLIRKMARNKKKPHGFYSTPKPVKLNCGGGFIELSKDENFATVKKVKCENGEAEIYNLKKNTEYFYRAESGETGSFKTDNIMPRWIYAEGYNNIRDFGGEKTQSGKIIAQGKIYRGIKLEGKDNAQAGIDALLDLGIKTDIDLRKEAVGKLTSSPLGRQINYILHPCDGYEEFLGGNRKIVKYLIDYFADEKLYPIYFHCHGGQDRTGTLGFMLGAILGLDDETLIREYELTMVTFPEWKISRSRKKKFKPFIDGLKTRDENKTLGENAVDFLLECGVSRAKMNKIREIMLENADDNI